MKSRFSSTITLLCMLALFVPVIGGTQAKKASAPAPTPPINPPVTNCNVTKPDATIDPSLLTSGLPCTVTAIAPFDLDNLQHAFDFNSWLSFLAINAPAAGGSIGKDAPTVWESWAEVEDVFLPHGQPPRPWGSPPVRPAICPQVKLPILRMVGKTPNVLSTVIQPFNTGPLIDQDGQYVHYEIAMNKPMFEYIVQNHLYSQAGQNKFAGPTEFPQGSVEQNTTNGTIGAIVIKAAWKVLDPKKDQASNFHTARVLVYIPPQENPKIQEKCYVATVGLVGLHYVHRTQLEPQWTWGTFEHVDNDPTQVAVDAKQLQKQYNFFNPACTNCTVNHQPPRPWNPNVVPFPGGYHSQIVRLTDETTEVKNLNKAFQGILGGTVWKNYMLISTQWPTDGTSKTDPNGVPAPTFLGNTTMETYIQGTVPQSSSSCMACHGNATDTTGRVSNFTYVLERAQ